MNPSNHKDIAAIKAITRKQLRGLGASNYHAVKVTEFLDPIGRQGHAYLYAIKEVIISIRSYRERPRLKPGTYTRLETVLDTLIDLLGNVLHAPFSSTADALTSQLSQQLIQAMAKPMRRWLH